jgi:hypothetical protein
MQTKEWTLMFYFASDNPLAISAVSQLKSIKNAGFHHDANVIVQFDPYTEGTPTHVFDVNVINKGKSKNKEPNIGFANDPTVQNLIEDKLWRGEKGESGAERIRDVIRAVMKENYKFDYIAPEAPDLNGASNNGDGNPTAKESVSKEIARVIGANGIPAVPDADGILNSERRKKSRELGPFVSLQKFLTFCRKEYPARHYMLFIMGHGVVVGNDVFLYDEHAENQSITLNEMSYALRTFKERLPKDASFELVSFHSCSVSSLEVAHELKNTANYMLASQGPTFVGSWPYREILMRIFTDLKPNPTSAEIRETIKQIFSYCVQNSADYLLAGYSYQLTLCDLRKLPELKESIQNLSRALFEGLRDAFSTSVILYSHWKAQSFFQEMYTDLCDFCYCIIDKCKETEENGIELNSSLWEIRNACQEVIKKLARPTEPNENSFVVACEFAGPAYQYSHGFSVYFPWSRPSEDSDIMQEYGSYLFHTEFTGAPAESSQWKSWRDFLDEYFSATQRVPKATELLVELSEVEKVSRFAPPKLSREEKLKEDMLSLIYNGEGPLGGSLEKTDPRDRTGGECGCPSIKNYPRDTRALKERRTQARPMPVSQSPF